MLYPVVPRQPVESLLANEYKDVIEDYVKYTFGKDDKNIVYLYSYNTYSNYRKVYFEFGESHINSWRTHFSIVLETDKDNIDYAKFIISDLAICMAKDANYIRNTLNCTVIGPRNKEWELFTREYEQVREQLCKSNSREECNQLWNKFFMCNTNSRTKEYLNEIKYIDKLYASYILPPYIDFCYSDEINGEYEIVHQRNLHHMTF